MDYTEWLPDWLEGYVDSLVAGAWSNHLEAEHPDAFLKVFANSAAPEPEVGPIYRGFYAQGNSTSDWMNKMMAWFLDDRRVVYINGVVLDTVHRESCTLWHADFETKLVGKLIWFTKAGEAKERFVTGYSYEKPGYHLFDRNCQHFRNWVLTGTDRSL